MQLTSSAFAEGASIPRMYTGEGNDVSPPLQWKDAPPDAKTLALIADDPDAPMGTWVHWVIYNIPSSQQGLTENVAKEKDLPDGSSQGTNDFKKSGYGGPMPPPGKLHRYFFKIYALNEKLDLKAGATKQQLLDSMKGHILAEGQLMGTYQRKG